MPITTNRENGEILGTLRVLLISALLVVYGQVSSEDFTDELARGFLGANERGIAHIRRRMTPRNARVTRRTAYYAGVAAIFQDLMPSARMIADEVLRKAGGGSVLFSHEQVAAMAFNAAFKTLQRVNNGAGGLALL
jgi:hypothetical protein